MISNEELIKRFADYVYYFHAYCTSDVEDHEMLKAVLCLLKEHEARELTFDEWREWKANPKRNPICKLWENDTSPMWILNPNNVHEPALLMGRLKLFAGKPTLDQCKAVNWNERNDCKNW